jgi:hypothetical protein
MPDQTTPSASPTTKSPSPAPLAEPDPRLLDLNPAVMEIRQACDERARRRTVLCAVRARSGPLPEGGGTSEICISFDTATILLDTASSPDLSS